MTHTPINSITRADVLALVRPELDAASCDKDLQKRLAHIGFGIEDTGSGRILTTLPHGLKVMPLPQLAQFS